jgi:hypothetical protein
MCPQQKRLRKLTLRFGRSIVNPTRRGRGAYGALFVNPVAVGVFSEKGVSAGAGADA